MQFDFLTIFFTIPAMLLSSTFHEYAHAYTAYLLGDDTAKAEGRMTLNPIAHIDPIGFMLMLFGKIGWSKPVPVNPYNFENPQLGNALVSAAGPLSNIFLAVVSALMLKFAVTVPMPVVFAEYMALFFVVMLFVNISLTLFNLMPIPPLDGSNIVEYFLPKQWQAGWSDLAKYTPYLLIILVIPFSPAFAFFSSFWYNLLSTVVGWAMTLVGLPQVP
jgi:Zn-dependent protease